MMSTEEQKLPEEAPRNMTAHERPNAVEKIIFLLLQQGALTQKNVDYGNRIRSKLEKPQSLLTVLKELKYVTDDDINQVLRANLQELQLDTLLAALDMIHRRRPVYCFQNPGSGPR